MTLLRAFLFLACGVISAQGHSTGAPPGACTSMLPQHGGATNIKGGNAKYKIVAPPQVGAGQQATISLGGAPFLGFMVRALNGEGKSDSGHFGPGQDTQAISCDGNGDTATHTDASTKTQVNLSWTAPGKPGVYRIMATFVEKFHTYYTGYYTDITVL